MNRIMEMIIFSKFSSKHAQINIHFRLKFDPNDRILLMSAAKSYLASVYVMCHYK